MIIDLQRAVAAVAPISEVSAPDPNDRATWAITFAPHATDAERAAALAILAKFDPLAPTIADVRAEASRRMQALLGARDAAHLDIIISNGTREAVRLLRLKDERPWTPQEAARAAGLQTVDGAIEAIRAASNVLEVMAPIPADYASDERWP